jgi:hypothetical protein
MKIEQHTVSGFRSLPRQYSITDVCKIADGRTRFRDPSSSLLLGGRRRSFKIGDQLLIIAGMHRSREEIIQTLVDLLQGNTNCNSCLIHSEVDFDEDLKNKFEQTVLTRLATENLIIIKH